MKSRYKVFALHFFPPFFFFFKKKLIILGHFQPAFPHMHFFFFTFASVFFSVWKMNLTHRNDSEEKNPAQSKVVLEKHAHMRSAIQVGDVESEWQRTRGMLTHTAEITGRRRRDGRSECESRASDRKRVKWVGGPGRQIEGGGGIAECVEGGGRLMERGSRVGRSSGGKEGGMEGVGWEWRRWKERGGQLAVRTSHAAGLRGGWWREGGGLAEGWGCAHHSANLTEDARTPCLPWSFCNNPGRREGDLKRMGCLKLRRRGREERKQSLKRSYIWLKLTHRGNQTWPSFFRRVITFTQNIILFRHELLQSLGGGVRWGGGSGRMDGWMGSNRDKQHVSWTQISIKAPGFLLPDSPPTPHSPTPPPHIPLAPRSPFRKLLPHHKAGGWWVTMVTGLTRPLHSSQTVLKVLLWNHLVSTELESSCFFSFLASVEAAWWKIPLCPDLHWGPSLLLCLKHLLHPLPSTHTVSHQVTLLFSLMMLWLQWCETHMRVNTCAIWQVYRCKFLRRDLLPMDICVFFYFTDVSATELIDTYVLPSLWNVAPYLCPLPKPEPQTQLLTPNSNPETCFPTLTPTLKAQLTRLKS